MPTAAPTVIFPPLPTEAVGAEDSVDAGDAGDAVDDAADPADVADAVGALEPEAEVVPGGAADRAVDAGLPEPLLEQPASTMLAANTDVIRALRVRIGDPSW